MPSSNSSPQTLSFDLAVYRLSAIKKTAYKFGDRCYVQVNAMPDNTEVYLKPKALDLDMDSLAGEFRNEALDQELREVVAEEAAGIRNLLLAQAFSATSLVDPVGETADYHTDPLGIRSSDAVALKSRPSSE